jgi:uncharacterized damage-inducible protein DinB
MTAAVSRRKHAILFVQGDRSMTKILFRYAACAMLAAALITPQLHAQGTGAQAALAKDAGTLSDKFSGLARVMADKYQWKPGEGVRSVADVFNLIVRENGMLTGLITGSPAGQFTPVTDPAQMQEAIKASYAKLQAAISGLSDADLQATVKMFGRDMTKQGALLAMLMDQHEHLGQSIAYARSNAVVPPWSK